jgi:hypothetical protein
LLGRRHAQSILTIRGTHRGFGNLSAPKSNNHGRFQVKMPKKDRQLVTFKDSCSRVAFWYRQIVTANSQSLTGFFFEING